jgi:ribonuclease P protein component
LSGVVIAKSTHFALHCRDLLSFEGQARDTSPLMREPVIGALLPKRWAKRAVTRNAIKRQIFHVVQDFESPLTGFAYVVRLRHGFDRTQFASASSSALKEAVRHELLGLFNMASTRLPKASHG